MEPIDKAYEVFVETLNQIDEYSDSVATEQDTRLKVIDRILVDVLGWPFEEIFTEPKSGNGYIDYKLTVNGFARLILEAKRDGKELGVKDQTPGRSFKLNGPVFKSPVVQEGLSQAIRYCGQKNAELACVSNGREWVVFRGSRLGDGKDTLEGVAYVFTSLNAIENSFKLFYDLLSYESVSAFRYRAHFQEAEGQPIRRYSFNRSLRTQGSRRLINRGRLSGDIDRIMTSFFRRLTGDDDPDFLSDCFVVTRESEQADETLARISEDLVGRIRDLNTENADELTEVIQRVRSTQRNEFVLLVGTKGAGKSTFIERFFKSVLPNQILRECIICRINLGDNDGDENTVVDWLNRHLLVSLETSVFGDQAPSFNDIQGMFFDDYKRWSTGTLRHLYDSDKDLFRIEFGKSVEKKREERPNDYIQRLLTHVVRVRGKLPCIIFDNADHFTIEFQERVFQYARSVYESELCLVIMPITDRTSWHMSREGALRSFENESLYLPTPSPKRVLERRISFIRRKIHDERKEPGRRYFTTKGIHLSLDDLTKFSTVLHSVFLSDNSISRAIGCLANRDIRQCLELAKNITTSPHINVEELLRLYLSESTFGIPNWKINTGIIKDKYDIYPEGDNRFVQNIYFLDDEIESSPLICLRLLYLLRDTRKSVSGENFLSVDQAVEYFRAMHVEPHIVLNWLNKMLEAGLCLSYDPTFTNIKDVQKIELAPAGLQHLFWGSRNRTYLQAMMEVTPILDREVYNNLNDLRKQPRRDVWHRELTAFLDYLLEEDSHFCHIPDHQAYESQRRLHANMKHMLEVQNQQASTSYQTAQSPIGQ